MQLAFLVPQRQLRRRLGDSHPGHDPSALEHHHAGLVAGSNRATRLEHRLDQVDPRKSPAHPRQVRPDPATLGSDPVTAGTQSPFLDVQEHSLAQHRVSLFLQRPLGVGLQHTLERPIPKSHLQPARAIPVDPGHQPVDSFFERGMKPVAVGLEASYTITPIDLGAVDRHPQPPAGGSQELDLLLRRRADVGPRHPHGLLGFDLASRQHDRRIGPCGHHHLAQAIAAGRPGRPNTRQQPRRLINTQHPTRPPPQQQPPVALQVGSRTCQRLGRDHLASLQPVQGPEHAGLDRRRAVGSGQ